MEKYKLYIYKHTLVKVNKRGKKRAIIFYDLLLDEPRNRVIKDFDHDDWIELVEK